MKYTFFVLSFMDIYPDGEVNPSVYLIPSCKIKKVKQCARQAKKDFYDNENSDLCIGDYFEINLEANNIRFKYVGDIDFTYKEHSLGVSFPNYIPMETV